MGTCHTKEAYDSTSQTLSRSDFEFYTKIGRGGLGSVWRVFHKASKHQFAIKEYKKVCITSEEALDSILNERRLLSTLQHNFIVNIQFAFQDKYKLYLGLDLKLGGDLRFTMIYHKFSEIEIKFILACVLLALEYLHKNSIIHKDIKPENIILDRNGYAFLTDFGTACVLKSKNSSETSGTPGYMAPEVICRQDHGVVSDYFGIGVILYEIMMGNRPYQGKNRKEIREEILKFQAKIHLDTVPQYWTVEAADFCNKLLKRKPQTRLGYNGIEEIKCHRWFQDLDFNMLNEFTLKAPYLPIGSNNYDKNHTEITHGIKSTKTPFSTRDFSEYQFFPSKVISKHNTSSN